jgi:hypothetical protein
VSHSATAAADNPEIDAELEGCSGLAGVSALDRLHEISPGRLVDLDAEPTASGSIIKHQTTGLNLGSGVTYHLAGYRELKLAQSFRMQSTCLETISR